jgi:microcystin-dependent protein
MVENIAITNNDKGEQNITKSKTTESVEVPSHSHTTQATNATIANANRQEAKTKQKRTKKRDQLDFESVEMQLAYGASFSLASRILNLHFSSFISMKCLICRAFNSSL